MSGKACQWISYDDLTRAAGADAEGRDEDGAFPAAAFAQLKRLGIMSNLPLKTTEVKKLLRILAAVGRGNLSVGRIVEGHANALFLIQLYGNPQQKATYQAKASAGGLFGVWNTDLPNQPVTLADGALRGRKSFASGADGLDYALITALTARGRQLVIVPCGQLAIDRSWWRPLGMKASGSHVVDFTGMRVEDDHLLGSSDDYIAEPWFSAGAIRFAAVHVGGMHAVFDTVVNHLDESHRADNPYQCHRLAQMAIEVETGYAWLDHAARSWANIGGRSETEMMSAARLAIERAALNVLELAERGVGAIGMIRPHPLERLIRDLRLYLRQPNPDGALTTIGVAVVDGLWRPGA